MPDGPQRDIFLLQALQDITLISVDNAQRIAKLQLRQTFEGSNAKNAQSIMDFKPDSDNVSINPKDNNILQQAHIEAIQELQRFNKSIDAAKPKQKQQGKPFQRRAGNYGNGRGRGYGGGRGRGNGYGGGRGRGKSYNNNWRYQQQGNQNSQENP